MNKIIEDMKSEGFTINDYVKYGLIYPIGLMTAIFIAELINCL